MDISSSNPMPGNAGNALREIVVACSFQERRLTAVVGLDVVHFDLGAVDDDLADIGHGLGLLDSDLAGSQAFDGVEHGLPQVTDCLVAHD